jgi:hypothetical protein
MKKQFVNFSSAALKIWMYYLIYAIAFFAYIIFYAVGSQYLDALRNRTYDAFTPYLIQLFGNFILGMLIGAEYLLRERKREGKWSFNVPHFVLIGIPSLIFGLYLLFYYINIPIISILPPFIGSSKWFFTVNQTLFGYILITSFSKQSRLFFK